MMNKQLLYEEFCVTTWLVFFMNSSGIDELKISKDSYRFFVK